MAILLLYGLKSYLVDYRTLVTLDYLKQQNVSHCLIRFMSLSQKSIISKMTHRFVCIFKF